MGEQFLLCTIYWLCCSWPWGTHNLQTSPISTFFVTFHIIIMVETSNLVHRSIVDSPSLQTTNNLLKRHRYVTWHILNFRVPIHISGMAVKFCTQWDYIRSCQRDDKPFPKGTYMTLFACTTVDLEKFCHSTPLSEVNSAANGGPLLLTPMTVYRVRQ